MAAAKTTRERLLDTALALFAESGVEAVSLRSINAAAGVSPGILHYHFGNRDTLLDALLHRELPALTAARTRRVDAIADSHAPPSTAAIAAALVDPYLEYLGRGEPAAGPFLRLLARLTLDGSALPETIDHSRAHDLARLARGLEGLVPGLDHAGAEHRLAMATDTGLFAAARWASPLDIGRTERSARAAALLHFIAAGLAVPG